MKNQVEILREKYENTQKRVLKYESDLKKPLEKDEEDNAVDESAREVLNGLYKIEKQNLLKIETALKELI